MKNSLFLSFLLFSFIGVFAQKTLTPSDEGSKVHFVIKNFGINTGGDITGLKGSVNINAKNPAASSADVTAEIKTIDTDNDRRDRHLQQADFFDAAKYPTIRLKSKSIKANDRAGEYTFIGEVTMHGVTKMISFPFNVLPQIDGYLLVGDFVLNRLDFGVGKESATMGDTVEVSLKVLAK